jgi:hypothetical protein
VYVAIAEPGDVNEDAGEEDSDGEDGLILGSLWHYYRHKDAHVLGEEFVNRP